MRRALLSLILLMGCADDPALPPPDTEPARVTIAGIGRVSRVEDQVIVPVALRNDGGPGVYKLRFVSARLQPGDPPEWTIETQLFEVSRGHEATVTFRLVGTGSSPLEGISVFSRGFGSTGFTKWHAYVPVDPTP